MRDMVKNGQPVTVLHRGRVWKYDAVPEPEAEKPDVCGNLYEAIGRSSTGAVIVRDNEGLLYVLKPIKAG